MQEVWGLGPILAALCVLAALPSGKWRAGEVLAGALFALGLQLKLIGLLYLPLALPAISCLSCV
jgi:hypothetical protein